jgi:predicted RNase H-like nuclease (RuvC/YqgF family)
VVKRSTVENLRKENKELRGQNEILLKRIANLKAELSLQKREKNGNIIQSA